MERFCIPYNMGIGRFSVTLCECGKRLERVLLLNKRLKQHRQLGSFRFNCFVDVRPEVRKLTRI